MADKSKNIKPDTVAEWMGSTGFIFPRNETELRRFETLHGKPDASIVSSAFSAQRIINNAFQKDAAKQISAAQESTHVEYRMVARNMANLPKNILDRMMNNQQKAKEANDGEPKETD